MSKIPLISINGSTDWSDAVTKLCTGDIGTSSTTWVQDEDAKAESLSVTENGTYDAASEIKYGYGYVTVSVLGTSATGKGKDGKMHRITVDATTGHLQDTVID
ncbi:MAG: hypothetical protein J6S60_10320 [Oscillospiraceae bacterium]|nr:hypothetical protein [Oscillospiraceae bacterium]